MFRSALLRTSMSAGRSAPALILRGASGCHWRHTVLNSAAQLRCPAQISPLCTISLGTRTLSDLRPSSLRHLAPVPGVTRKVELIHSTSKSFEISTRDKKREEVRYENLKVDPESVSSTSTVTPTFGGPNPTSPVHEGNDVDMLAGLKSDLKTVRDTFRLQDVPREVFYIGMVGLVPYVATTFSTLYLAWDLKNAQLHGLSYLVSTDTAEKLLNVLEPLQVGYGAVILSFLGAIHWGLEFAGYGGRKSVRRYAIGLLAPALAWPTTLFPLHEALLTQFLGFTGMYFFDTSATSAGLAPSWYTTYRFVLTFVVGACIVLTLIGRGQIGQHFVHSTSPTEHLREIRADQRRNLERERQERRLKLEIESHKQSTNDDANNGDKGHETFGDKQEKHSSSDRRQEKTEEFQGKGGVKPGGGGEPIREEMRSKPITITIHKDQDLNYGNETRPEPSEEKKANFMPMPEGK